MAFPGCPAGMQLGITSKDIQQQTTQKGEAFPLSSPHPYGTADFLTPAGAAVWPHGRPAQGTKRQKKNLNKTSCFLSELPWITTRPNKHQVQEDGSSWECTASMRSKNSNCLVQELSALEHLTQMAGFNSPLVQHRNLDTYLVLHSAWELTTELLNQFSLYTYSK